MIVLKIGGSLFDSARELLKWVADEERDVLVVPGGGAFADKVRDVYGTTTLSDDAAHWMALLAMDQYGYYLSDGTGIPLADYDQRQGDTDRAGLRDLEERRCAASFVGRDLGHRRRVDGDKDESAAR